MIALMESIADTARVLLGSVQDEMLRYAGLFGAGMLFAAAALAAVAITLAARRTRRPIRIPTTPAVAR